MAQDANGTPTSKGIPTYNTGADPPSGKGFNAAMAAIDGLFVASDSSISTLTTTVNTKPGLGIVVALGG